MLEIEMTGGQEDRQDLIDVGANPADADWSCEPQRHVVALKL
jgi:hypothetical protein